MKNKALRIAVLLLMALIATMALRARGHAQNVPDSSAPLTKSSILRPPAGAKVALVEFADLQCPDCANAAPLLEEASKTYNIPLVVYDFPLPQHNWSFEAAVMAHYLRTKSTPKNPIERKFRLFIYENQSAITPQNLRSYIEKFGKANGVAIPFVVDPQGKFAAAVRKDKDKGISVNIQHTPTIYVVSTKQTGTPFVEVVDRRNLFAMIDDMIAQTKSAPSAKKSTTAKK
ncbi:MAG TPA: thioredoxin domain-containing protein [Terriglobales bacterium]|nr:thioredoxin domain-containing protein [Terriglobales bacterium]